MKRKEMLKRIALWTAGICALSVGCFVAPKVVRSLGDVMQTAEQNTSSPKITIESEGYDLSYAPTAVVGKAYRIFNATAKDGEGNTLKVAAKVWLYYYSSTKSRVNVQYGTFVPWQAGEYVVEYTATDKHGNKASLTYNVECKTAQSLTLSLSEKTQTGIAGMRVTVATPLLDNVSGKSATRIQATRKAGGEPEIIGEDLTFCPTYAGTYVIEYFCSDYVSEAVASYEISVENNPAPVFFGEANVPKYFVKDKTYTLDMEVSDTMGNMQLYAYGITAVDRTPPTITLIKGETECKVGEYLAVWQATAKDALGKELEMLVYVYKPDGIIKEITDGYFYGEKAGVYTIYYHTFDEKGNVAMEHYEVTVG